MGIRLRQSQGTGTFGSNRWPRSAIAVRKGDHCQCVATRQYLQLERYEHMQHGVHPCSCQNCDGQRYRDKEGSYKMLLLGTRIKISTAAELSQSRLNLALLRALLCSVSHCS
jgi:hypothetical protein